MAPEQKIARYQYLYKNLLRFYPKRHRERFGESMEQTFRDLCRERAEAGEGLVGFVLWIFIETSAGIMRENKMQNKSIIRIALVTTILLMVPLLAMRFTEEVNWTLSDFVIMGALLFGSGLTYELVSRKGSSIAYKAGVGVAVVTSLLLVWMNGAVGIIGNEDNPANLLYGGVLLVGLIGAALANLRAKGMSRALFAMAIAQFLVPVIAMMIWRPSLEYPPGIIGVFVLNVFFAFLFTVSGLLFRRAGSDLERNFELR